VRRTSPDRAQFVFDAFGRGVILDHAPGRAERIRLRVRLLLGFGTPARPLGDRVDPYDPRGPDVDGATGAGDRAPCRPPDLPLVGSVALSEPSTADATDARTEPGAGDSGLG
jgi:hypothetical protein